MEQTIGEERVRVSFNPSNSDVVYQIKAKSAELINLLINSTDVDNTDVYALEKAVGDIEQGCMWGVKAYTAEVNNKFLINQNK